MTVNLTHIDAGLRVCVDSAENGQLSGRVYSKRLIEPISFRDIGTLLLKLEALLDHQQFPQAFQRTRTFRKRMDPAEVPVSCSWENGMPTEVVEAAVGSLFTFQIYVISRRNTTWQGKIDWLDGAGAAQDFSSVLELIKLIDRHIFS